ncbi:beta-1,4 N-acetylgalactosaminyltransferase 1-like [Glandiceps talaboti]
MATCACRYQILRRKRWDLTVFLLILLILADITIHIYWTTDSVALAREYRINTEREESSEDLRIDDNRKENGDTDCTCPGNNIVGPLEDEEDIDRRKHEYDIWDNKEKLLQEPLSICQAMSPINFVGSGLSVQPLKTIRITGLRIHRQYYLQNLIHNQTFVSFKSSNNLGIIYTDCPGKILQGVRIIGNNTRELKISIGPGFDTVNTVLQCIVYRSVYYHVKARDVIDFQFLRFTASIHVLIQRPALPRLHVSLDDSDVNSLVTVVTKTFERYDAVDRLVKSINKFYPKMTIIIADDSKETEEIKGFNIKHYLMPFAEGYNAGKNLLLSQVRTKYFLWVDDDFIFTERTRLELFIEKLQSPKSDLDLVGGMFEQDDGSLLPCICTNTDKYFTVLDITGGKEGFCISAKKSNHGRVEEFPNCHFLDMVANFWMAKTDSVRKVGFDLRYERIAHREFFMDAVGVLRIAQCDDVVVRHVAIRNPKYNKFRFLEDKPEETLNYVNHLLYKNYLKCFQSWYGPAMTKAMNKGKKMAKARAKS